MDGATMEIVQGITLETVSTSNLPDTESLLGELGSMYPVVTYPAAEVSAEEEPGDGDDVTDAAEERREALDATILAGLLWP